MTRLLCLLWDEEMTMVGGVRLLIEDEAAALVNWERAKGKEFTCFAIGCGGTVRIGEQFTGPFHCVQCDGPEQHKHSINYYPSTPDVECAIPVPPYPFDHKPSRKERLAALSIIRSRWRSWSAFLALLRDSPES